MSIKSNLMFWLFLSMIKPLPAAAPVVHVYFAHLYLNQYKPFSTQKERDAFMRGTLFPDIRYIAFIPRTATHEKNVTLEKVKSTKNPFTAGMLFHVYVDEQRESIAQRIGIYDHLKNIPKYKGLLLKAVEDELCYQKIDSQEVCKALRFFDTEERRYNVSIATRMRWHKLLKNYLSQSPLSLLKQRTEKNKGYLHVSPDYTKRFYQLMKQYTTDKKVIEYVAHLINEFKKVLKI